MNNELFEALTILEREKNISKETLLDAIKQSLLQACKNHYGKADASRSLRVFCVEVMLSCKLLIEFFSDNASCISGVIEFFSESYSVCDFSSSSL